MKRTRFASIALAVFCVAAVSASAAVTFGGSFTGTFSEVNSSTELAYTDNVVNTDLINGLTPSGVVTVATNSNTSGAWKTGNNSSAGKLNDGAHGPTFSTGNVQGAWPNPSATATYTLGLGANGLGFDVTSIRSIAAWNGAAFGNQAWTLAVQPAGGGAFVDAITVNYQPLLSGAAGATQVLLSELNITGVQAVRVTTISVNAGANGGSFLWRELDVIGAATVPEPSSALLVGLGGLAVLRRRR